ncbi:MAG TPA: hypothetical protein VK989_08775, partial [Polyangia bacterium]|nr:hypothetical protein [Polyangia bacterium]
GDAVKVEVQSVSVVRRKIDFALAGHVGRESGRPERAKRGRQGRDDGRVGADKRRTKRGDAATDKRRGGKRGGKTRR